MEKIIYECDVKNDDNKLSIENSSQKSEKELKEERLKELREHRLNYFLSIKNV